MLNFQGVLVVDLEFDEFLNMEVFFISKKEVRAQSSDIFVEDKARGVFWW